MTAVLAATADASAFTSFLPNLVAVTTVLSGALAVIAAISKPARLRRDLATITSMLDVEKPGARHDALESRQQDLAAQILAHQLTPAFRLTWPFFAWGVLAAVAFASGTYVFDYLRMTPATETSFPGAVAYAFGDDPGAIVIVPIMYFYVLPMIPLAYANTLLGRARVMADFRAGRRVRIPQPTNPNGRVTVSPLRVQAVTKSGGPALRGWARFWRWIKWYLATLAPGLFVTALGLIGGALAALSWEGGSRADMALSAPLVGFAFLLFILSGAVLFLSSAIFSAFITLTSGRTAHYPARRRSS